MKTVFISDCSLKHALSKGQELPLCERSKILASLDHLNLDALELPAVQNGAEGVIANRITATKAEHAMVCVPVGYDEASVALAWDSIKDAKKPCLQIEYPLSTVQLEYTFHQKAQAALETIRSLAVACKALCPHVEMIAKDATRADKELLAQLCTVLNETGVEVLTLCDETGASLPSEIEAMVGSVRPIWSGKLFVQVSDSIGMGIACAMAAISAGCDGVKTSIFGGETLSLSALSHLLQVRGDGMGFTTNLSVPAARPTIEALLKHSTPIAESNSVLTADALRLTANSTLSEVCEAIASLGYDLSEEDCGKVHKELMRVGAKKDTIGQKELEAIIAGSAMAVPSTYHIEAFVINSGSVLSSTAQVVLTRRDERLQGVSFGDGPIDAAFHAIEQIIGHHYELEDFQIQSVTRGREALGSALVKLRSEGRLYSGNGVSTDIVGAAIRAYVNALNKIVYEEN